MNRSIREGIQLLAGLVLLLWISPAASAAGETSPGEPEAVPANEYPIYNRVVTDKFLTSRTRLVLVQRFTATRLAPWEEEPPGRRFFEVNDYFGKQMDPGLITDFIIKTSRPWRLESRFDFGVPHRFVSGDQLEGPEVSLAPLAVQQGPRRGGPPPTVGVLQFSRVAFDGRQNHALVYVSVDRPDGTGGGFLMWLERRGEAWRIFDTEVLWSVRP